jgi:hypothetical protein
VCLFPRCGQGFDGLNPRNLPEIIWIAVRQAISLRSVV